MEVADLWEGVVGSMVDHLGHPKMVEVLQKVEDLQGAVVDTPVRSMTEQSLWGVEVLAAMEELGPVLVCAAQEQFRALAAASADVRCPRSFQSSHEVAGLEGKTPLKEDHGSFDRPGLPGEPLGLRIEHGTAQSHNFGGRRSKASENETRLNQLF